MTSVSTPRVLAGSRLSTHLVSNDDKQQPSTRNCCGNRALRRVGQQEAHVPGARDPDTTHITRTGGSQHSHVELTHAHGYTWECQLKGQDASEGLVASSNLNCQ